MFLNKSALTLSAKESSLKFTLIISDDSPNGYVNSLSSANAGKTWTTSTYTDKRASVGILTNDVVSVVTSTPAKTGYVFSGWSESSGGTVAYAGTSFSVTISSATQDVYKTLYAIFLKQRTFTLSYNANGGSNAPASQSQTTTSSSYTFTISSSIPTRTDYSFQGWSNTSSGSVAYSAGGQITLTANKTIYAVWSPDYKSVSLSGSGTFTVPALVTKLRVTIKGGGGGSGGSVAHKKGNNDNTGDVTATGGAGGKGGYRQITIDTSPGATISYSVGGAGSGASKPTTYQTQTNGGTGGTSTFGSYSATGGSGGKGGYLTRTGTTSDGYSYAVHNGSAGSNGSPSGSGGSGAGTNTASMPSSKNGFTYAAGSNGGAGSIVVEYGGSIQG